MPRKRQPKEPCDCLECRDVFPSDDILGTAVARQQPPPKCLIFYVPSCLETSNVEEPPSELPHVNSIVQQGISGLLALRSGINLLETCVLLGLLFAYHAFIDVSFSHNTTASIVEKIKCT